jgi:hypothetical protein
MEGHISTHFYKIQTFIWQYPAASSTAQIGLNNSSQKFSTSHTPNGYSATSLSTTKRNGYLHNKKAEEIALELESLAGLAPEVS